MKDIGLLAKGNDGDDNSLGLDVLKVGLRQQTHRLAATVLGEDERVAAEAHGARLEAIAIHTDGHLTKFWWTLFCETKAGQQWQRGGEETMRSGCKQDP